MSIRIETNNLGRHFGSIRAVDGVTFSVSKSEVLGFLGPNGAGKSTTMKMLTCFLTPSFGSARVGGFDVVNESKKVRALLGYLPENAPIYGEMEVRGFLRFAAEVRGYMGEKRNSAVDRVVELASIKDVIGQRIETLSKGYKRRVGLAQALIHDPEILILDEPTDGLDPNQKHEVRKLINQMAAEKCIVLSTHILEEVDEVCTRAIIISSGKIVADDTPDGLRRRSSSCGAVSITFGASEAQVDLEKIAAGLKSVEGVRKVILGEAPGGGSVITALPQKGKEIVSAVIKRADEHRWKYRDVKVSPGQLDEVFREITSGSERVSQQRGAGL